MQLKPIAAGALVLATLLSALPAAAQNIAIVNGKPVPKARMETLLLQATRSGQAVTPEMEKQARDQLVLREIFAQEAEKRGIGGSREFRAQMELARQSLLIRDSNAQLPPSTSSIISEPSLRRWSLPSWRKTSEPVSVGLLVMLSAR